MLYQDKIKAPQTQGVEMKTVLFIAGLDEKYYYSAFIEACASKNIKVYVLDPSRFPTEAKLTLELDNEGNVSGFVDVYSLKNDVFEMTSLNILQIDVAWYLRESPIKTMPQGSLPDLESRFSENEAKGSVRSLLSALKCEWINKREVINYIESNKFYQQIHAQRAGLKVPATLITNDPERINNFLSEDSHLLLKTIGYINIDDNNQMFLYSQLIPREELESSQSSIRHCPIFSQKYIEKLYEHRVMVIGNVVLSCRIDSQASSLTKIDWRHYDFENVEHVQVELPLSVQKCLLKFMDSIGLRYGALDLIETPSGEFVFLEVNPSGQWGWIADFAKLPIPEAVAQMFL